MKARILVRLGALAALALTFASSPAGANPWTPLAGGRARRRLATPIRRSPMTAPPGTITLRAWRAAPTCASMSATKWRDRKSMSRGSARRSKTAAEWPPASSYRAASKTSSLRSVRRCFCPTITSPASTS